MLTAAPQVNQLFDTTPLWMPCHNLSTSRGRETRSTRSSSDWRVLRRMKAATSICIEGRGHRRHLRTLLARDGEGNDTAGVEVPYVEV